jgi:hypothetical protein
MIIHKIDEDAPEKHIEFVEKGRHDLVPGDYLYE